MIKKKAKKDLSVVYNSVCCGRSSFWGWFILALGLFLLGKQQGWIPSNVSLWPPVLIIIGVYILIRYHLQKRCD